MRLIVRTVLFLAACAALPAGAVDQVEPYDVLGAKLGMTANEAAAAMKMHLPGVNLTLSPTTTKLTPGKRYTDTIVGHAEQGSVFLEFAETYPYNPAHPESLHLMSYTVAYKTDAQKQAIHDTAVTKFGPPVVDSGFAAIWCGHPVDLGGYTMRCTTPEPTVKLQGAVLDMFDNTIETRAHDAWEKAQKVSAPPM